MKKEAATVKKRLASLDILRGLDLWLLLMIGPLLHKMISCGYFEGCTGLRHHLSHVSWEGFALWDIIMPLFMFMSGITIPFSMSAYRNGVKPEKEFYLKLLKRFCLLFFLGWIVQGNLLALDLKLFHPFANTLQAIAVGYVAAALMFVHFKPKGQIVLTAGLFLAYLLAFIVTDMNLDPQSNIAMLTDKAILGSHRDGVNWAVDGSWSYKEKYQYTWILSSLNFIVTVMLGCFAGEIIRGKDDKVAGRKALILAGTGAALIAAGLAMSPLFPIIKKIWSSSMTLYSGGICFLLMAATYYIVDVKGWGGEMKWIKFFGMNSITAYVVAHVCDFSSLAGGLLFGLEHIVGGFYPVVITFAEVSILFLIMRYLYNKGIFLKV
jgi:predicted acyltransferase